MFSWQLLTPVSQSLVRQSGRENDWASAWQNQQKMGLTTSEGSDQLGIRQVWSVFAVRMKKVTYWASAKSDQSLLSAWRKLPTERTAKTLISLGGCPGWSESSLGANDILLFFNCLFTQQWSLAGGVNNRRQTWSVYLTGQDLHCSNNVMQYSLACAVHVVHT